MLRKPTSPVKVLNKATRVYVDDIPSPANYLVYQVY
ncbi:unnamed protein product [Linum tenue]|uniref:Uncharacterized protein n=1 Tax=Linum tenue TaxID=586396 RepID=A0AAV0QLF8_9ROSI|nr:unnamed protein product [Linum tenue]